MECVSFGKGIDVDLHMSAFVVYSLGWLLPTILDVYKRQVGSRVVYDVCTEGGGNLCNLSPDISKSDDPEAHGGKFVKMFGKMSENPVAHVAFFFYIVVIVAHLLQQIKEHGKGVLCHRICGVSCHIAPCYACLLYTSRCV